MDRQNDAQVELIDTIARGTLKAAEASWHAAITEVVRNVDDIRLDQHTLKLNVTKLESSFRKYERGGSHSEQHMSAFPRQDKTIASQCENLALSKSKPEATTGISEKNMNRLKDVANSAARGVLTSMQSWRDGVVISLKGLESRLLACEPRSRCARWLWRSGDTTQGGWVPWEFEALNSSPQLFVWRPTDATHVTTTHAGLYRVSVGIFTQNNATIQLSIQGETVLTLEPQSSSKNHPPKRSDDTIRTLQCPKQKYNKRDACSLYESHVLRQSQHSAGQITCLAIDEFLSLPSLCDIAIRFDPGSSKDPAHQAFLAITKI